MSSSITSIFKNNSEINGEAIKARLKYFGAIESADNVVICLAMYGYCHFNHAGNKIDDLRMHSTFSRRKCLKSVIKHFLRNHNDSDGINYVELFMKLDDLMEFIDVNRQKMIRGKKAAGEAVIFLTKRYLIPVKLLAFAFQTNPIRLRDLMTFAVMKEKNGMFVKHPWMHSVLEMARDDIIRKDGSKRGFFS
jgi:hypothetical protein